MNEDRVLTEVRRLVSELPDCLISFEQILPERKLMEDLGIDSVAMVDLMVAVEDCFDIYFDPVQTNMAEVFETIGSLAAYIWAQIGDKPLESPRR